MDILLCLYGWASLLAKISASKCFLSFAEQNLGFFFNLACPLDFQVAFVILILLAWDIFLCLY